MAEGQTLPGTAEDFVFKHIPKLTELLPSTGGIPGIVYAQICVHNRKRAQNEGWKQIQGAKIYTILGPDDRVDMELLAKGTPVLGQGPESGARKCWVDTEVYTLTGHVDPKAPVKAVSASTKKTTEVSQSAEA